MSDQHEPDPAALDELLRAFGESDPATADETAPPVTLPQDPPASSPPPAADDHGDDTAAGTDDASAVNPDDNPDDEVDLGALVASVDRADPIDTSIDDEFDLAVFEPADEPASDRPAPPEPIPVVEVVEVIDVDDPPDPAPESDAESTSDHVTSTADEPVAPSIIKIDDFSGSVVVEPAPAASPSVPPDPLLAAGSSRERSDPATDEDADPDVTGNGDGGEGPIVISIDDEDLPDPVYVEGNLERSGNRTIVFIEDDDTGDTVAPEVERDIRRGIEPRMRERRAAVKRAIGRKRLRWVVAIAAVVIVGVAALAVLGSSLFAIRAENVTVVGQVYADDAAVDAVVDDLVGTPALLVDTQAAEDELEAIPWVGRARVTVDFPYTATIDLAERRPWATYQGPDGRYRVLDDEGRVLAVLDGYPFAYVLLNGPDPVDLDAGQFAPQGYAAAADLAKTLTSSIRGRVEVIDVTADGTSLNLLLDDGTTVRFGAARDLLDKLIRLETVLANNPDLEPGVIDVSTSEVTL